MVVLGGAAVSYERGTPVGRVVGAAQEDVEARVVACRSIPAQIRQLILYISNNKG